MAKQIIHYVTVTGVDPFQSWMDQLADLRAKVAILRRIDRLAVGNPGDHKYVKSGVRELRIDIGPGYRIYFATEAGALVLLLCAGSKRSQTADIERAANYLVDYWRRR